MLNRYYYCVKSGARRSKPIMFFLIFIFFNIKNFLRSSVNAYRCLICCLLQLFCFRRMYKILILTLLITLSFADCPLNHYPRRTALGNFSLTQLSLKLSSIMIPIFMVHPRSSSIHLLSHFRQIVSA